MFWEVFKDSILCWIRILLFKVGIDSSNFFGNSICVVVSVVVGFMGLLVDNILVYVGWLNESIFVKCYDKNVFDNEMFF